MIQKFILALSSLGFMMFVLPVSAAECQGCLCPCDPCNLCPLPAMKDAPIKDNEPDLCKRIRQQVPPVLTSIFPVSIGRLRYVLEKAEM